MHQHYVTRVMIPTLNIPEHPASTLTLLIFTVHSTAVKTIATQMPMTRPWICGGTWWQVAMRRWQLCSDPVQPTWWTHAYSAIWHHQMAPEDRWAQQTLTMFHRFTSVWGWFFFLGGGGFHKSNLRAVSVGVMQNECAISLSGDSESHMHCTNAGKSIVSTHHIYLCRGVVVMMVIRKMRSTKQRRKTGLSSGISFAV